MAAELPYGGGKAGIVAEPDTPSKEHAEIVRRFARLIRRYRSIYVPGPDVGTNDADMKTWLAENKAGFSELSARRLEAGIAHRDRAMRRNMTELVDLLASDAELLPGQAAERISLRRLTDKESERTAKDIMDPMPAIGIHCGLQEAAELIVKTESNIIAVLNGVGKLAGVVTTWDITRAVAGGACEQSVEMIMTREVISVAPECSILEMVTGLEQHQFSAMPVVDDGKLLGVVSSDLLAQRYLLKLLRSQAN